MKFDDVITEEKYNGLCEAGEVLLDHLFEDVIEVQHTGNPEPLSNWLPDQFSQHYTPLFAKQFLVTAVTLVGLLDQWDGKSTIVSCTADALALHCLIEQAKTLVELRADEAGREASETDLDFGDFVELLCPDADFELLFDPSLDGVEDTDAAAHLGMLLRFDQWFVPYASSGWIHPYCRPSDAR